MKNISYNLRIKQIFILTFLLFSFNLQAQQTFKFLSYNELTHLTDSEKKLYINEVRTLINALTESSKISVWQYVFLPIAEAQSERAEFNVPSTNTATELDRLDSLMRAARMYKKAGAEHNSSIAKQMADENSKAFSQRMNKVKLNLRTPADLKIFNELQTEFSKDFPTMASSIQQLHAKTAVQKIVEPPKTQTNVPSKPKNSPSQAYCIYAGFVIYGDKCIANKRLPVDFKLDEIKNEFFQCDNESEILCNPLLFGFKKNCFKVETREVCSEKPICIDRSVNATKKCLQKSDTTDQLKQILDLWKNPKNKNVYEKFMNDMNLLCNAKNFSSDDVRQTCKVASTRFNAIIEKNFPGKADYKIQTEPTVSTPSQK